MFGLEKTIFLSHVVHVKKYMHVVKLMKIVSKLVP